MLDSVALAYVQSCQCCRHHRDETPAVLSLDSCLVLLSMTVFLSYCASPCGAVIVMLSQSSGVLSHVTPPTHAVISVTPASACISHVEDLVLGASPAIVQCFEASLPFSCTCGIRAAFSTFLTTIAAACLFVLYPRCAIPLHTASAPPLPKEDRHLLV